MFIKSAVAVAIFASFAAAQTTDNSTISPDSVALTIRAGWCSGQISTCGYLCAGDTNQNECTPENLTFNCTCASNNSAPGLQYYKQSLPTFICQQIYDVCIQNTEGNKAGQDRCTANRQANCGTLDPENYTAPASTSSSSTASGTPTPTGTGAGASVTPEPTTTSSAGSAATMAAREFGTGVLAAGFAAAFGLML